MCVHEEGGEQCMHMCAVHMGEGWMNAGEGFDNFMSIHFGGDIEDTCCTFSSM